MTNHIALPLLLASKTDEVNFLKGIRSALDPQLYLSSLFTDELIHWFETMVNNDLAPDVMGTLKSANERTMASVGDMVERTEQLDKKIRNLEVKNATLNNDVAILTADRDDTEIKRRALEVTIAKLQDDQSLMVRRALVDAKKRYEMQQQILKLKALLFDKEHPDNE